MTKRNNKKTPEPMFVGTEPEEVVFTLVNPEFTTKVLEGFSQVYPEQEEMVTTDALPGFTQESPITNVTDYFFSEEEPKPETDDGTRPEPPAEKTLTFQELAEKIIESVDGKLPTEAMERFMPPGEKEYKHPFDPINGLHYQLNNAIQPLVDSMQKIIRDPYKAKESMSEQHFNYMVKEYGYLHSFLELSHKLIKERLRERV